MVLAVDLAEIVSSLNPLDSSWGTEVLNNFKDYHQLNFISIKWLEKSKNKAIKICVIG